MDHPVPVFDHAWAENIRLRLHSILCAVIANRPPVAHVSRGHVVHLFGPIRRRLARDFSLPTGQAAGYNYSIPMTQADIEHTLHDLAAYFALHKTPGRHPHIAALRGAFQLFDVDLLPENLVVRGIVPQESSQDFQNRMRQQVEAFQNRMRQQAEAFRASLDAEYRALRANIAENDQRMVIRQVDEKQALTAQHAAERQALAAQHAAERQALAARHAPEKQALADQHAAEKQSRVEGERKVLDELRQAHAAARRTRGIEHNQQVSAFYSSRPSSRPSQSMAPEDVINWIMSS